MIKQLLNDLFGPSVNEFKKFKHNYKNLSNRDKIMKRMKKLLLARNIIVNEMEIQYLYNNKLAYKAFEEADNQLKLAYKYLENELNDLEQDYILK